MDKFQLTVNPIRTLSYGLSVFFFQIFLSSLNNLQSGFSFSITFILVVITVAEDFECLIFFLRRAELWELSEMTQTACCDTSGIPNSQTVFASDQWFHLQFGFSSNQIQSSHC